jgi:hypothetical protein
MRLDKAVGLGPRLEVSLRRPRRMRYVVHDPVLAFSTEQLETFKTRRALQIATAVLSAFFKLCDLISRHLKVIHRNKPHNMLFSNRSSPR